MVLEDPPPSQRTFTTFAHLDSALLPLFQCEMTSLAVPLKHLSALCQVGLKHSSISVDLSVVDDGKLDDRLLNL